RGERLELLPAERLIEQRPLGPFPARAAAIRPQQLGVDPLRDDHDVQARLRSEGIRALKPVCNRPVDVWQYGAPAVRGDDVVDERPTVGQVPPYGLEELPRREMIRQDASRGSRAVRVHEDRAVALPGTLQVRATVGDVDA